MLPSPSMLREDCLLPLDTAIRSSIISCDFLNIFSVDVNDVGNFYHLYILLLLYIVGVRLRLKLLCLSNFTLYLGSGMTFSFT